MTTADPISLATWSSTTAQPEPVTPVADGYLGRHRALARTRLTVRRLFYLARHRRR